MGVEIIKKLMIPPPNAYFITIKITINLYNNKTSFERVL